MIEARKRPRQKRSEATVAAMLEAAARILEEGGLSALTTNLVAARAGVSVGSLYQYFPSKDAILVALIRVERDALLQGLRQAMDQARMARSPNLRRTVRAMCVVAVAHQMTRPALARALDYAELLLPLDGETDAIDREIGSLVMASLAAHRNELRRQSLQAAALDVAALVKGLVDAAGRRGETDADALARRAERAALGYLLYT